jgi:hypothetical protein
MNSIFDLTGFSFAVSIVYGFTAMCMLWLGLRFLDKTHNRPFKDAIAKIREDSIATAIYYGLRWFGACMLLGFVMSR